MEDDFRITDHPSCSNGGDQSRDRQKSKPAFFEACARNACIGPRRELKTSPGNLGHASIEMTSRYIHANPEESSGDYLRL